MRFHNQNCHLVAGSIANHYPTYNRLKQAGWEWYATLHTFLVQIGFWCTHTDHSIFIFHWGQSIIIVPVYVDDKLLAGNDEQLLNSIQNSISTHFKFSELSAVSWILGIHIHHTIDSGT